MTPLRIGNITGLESLAELKVLNLAGNLIRDQTAPQIKISQILYMTTCS